MLGYNVSGVLGSSFSNFEAGAGNSAEIGEVDSLTGMGLLMA
jgi:hypothetical protein